MLNPGLINIVEVMVSVVVCLSWRGMIDRERIQRPVANDAMWRVSEGLYLAISY